MANHRAVSGFRQRGKFSAVDYTSPRVGLRMEDPGKGIWDFFAVRPAMPFLPDGVSPEGERGGKNFPPSEGVVTPLVARREWGYTSRHPVPTVREVCMPKKERDREIRRRRQRKTKMHFLRERLAGTKDPKARAVLVQKILKINPQANITQK
jgi:hypothetical protein